LRIRVERSGGFTGIPISKEMDSKDLPSELKDTAKKIMNNQNLSSIPTKSIPIGAADHYIYRITFQDGANRKLIECNQYDIQDDIKLLVKYIEKYSKN